jgi:hypothetical protein
MCEIFHVFGLFCVVFEMRGDVSTRVESDVFSTGVQEPAGTPI